MARGTKWRLRSRCLKAQVALRRARPRGPGHAPWYTPCETSDTTAPTPPGPPTNAKKQLPVVSAVGSSRLPVRSRGRRARALLELVARVGIEIKAVELLQILDSPERLFAERRLPLEGVQNDPFQQIAQTQVVVLRKRLEHLEDSFFHPDTGLHALDQETVF